MKKVIEKISNGHILRVTLDVESLIKDIDDRIREVKDMDEDRDGIAAGMMEIGASDDSYVSVETAVKDLEEIKAIVSTWEDEKTHQDIIDAMCLKKNGTFKRTAKPILVEQKYGEYYQDSYGWNTGTVRIEASSDTEAEVMFSCIITHY